jgi:putative redox protein
MSDLAVELEWEEKLRFKGTGRNDSALTVDGAAAAGPSPMELLLMGLAGCMGVDVVDILDKMRVPLSALVVRAEGVRREVAPRRFEAVRLTYRVRGVPGPDRPKVQRAVDLSRETYCSVLHTMQPDLDLEVRIEHG